MIYVKDIYIERKIVKEITIKLEELEIKILRKSHLNETRGL